MAERITVGALADLQARGWLAGKAGTQPICAFWSDGEAFALDDRCPHMGFPLHRGTVEGGLVTCHWHNARFDLGSGGTLDAWADDVRSYPVDVSGGNVTVVVDTPPDHSGHLRHRLGEGLAHGITLVTAKSVLGLLDAGEPVADIVRVGVEYGTRFRGAGWGSGLTVLTAMANIAPLLDPADRPLALVHGLAFVSRDTRGRAPWFALEPLGARAAPPDRLARWYRRFVETRSGGAAERTLASAVAAGAEPGWLAATMLAAVTDHVLADGGHTLDFTNKAFEVLDLLGWEGAGQVLATLAAQTAGAHRSEEDGAWRHPDDLAGRVATAIAALPARLADAAGNEGFGRGTRDRRRSVAALAWAVLDEDPAQVVAVVDRAIDAGATPEELGRAVAYAGALRITRFHTQNDHADWDVVHHAFTAANALHQALVRAPTPEVVRGVYHAALRTYLDRFLNVPPARLPEATAGRLDDLAACWDSEGRVDEAGAIVYGHVMSGGAPGPVIAAVGHALLSEDAEFHWFQVFEAAVRQFHAWPAGSEEGALILAGAARFLAAHTPTRRELAQVVRIASRLRRGEALYEEAP